MIGDILQPSHLLFILVIALLVLGPKRLPEVGRALGRGLRDFRNALSTDEIREHVTSTRDAFNPDELRDQILAPTDTAGTPGVAPPPTEAAEAPVDQATHQVATTPDPASTDDAASSPQEAIQSPEPTAAAPTPEHIP